MKKLNNKGFGIMSLLIGLSALMILSVMVIPIVSQTMTNGQVTSMESTVLSLQTDVQNYTGAGGNLSTLGIGSATGSSTINGLQSVAYKYLVPVSWTPNTVLNASYANLTAQNGWYNVPNGGFAQAYLVTTGSNVFSGGNPPEFALGLYAPAMTNAQVNTVINYLQSKEPSGSFDEFIWNGAVYTWNPANKNWENSSNQTIPLNTGAGNGQLIFGFNGYLNGNGSLVQSSYTYNVSDPDFFTTPGQYQFTIPGTSLTISVAGGAGGYGQNYDTYASAGLGGSGGTNVYSFINLTPGSILTIYVAGAGSNAGGPNGGGDAGGNGGNGGYAGGYGGVSAIAAGGGGGGGASSVWLNGVQLICAGGGGGGGGTSFNFYRYAGGNGGYAGGNGGNGSNYGAGGGGGGGGCVGAGGAGGAGSSNSAGLGGSGGSGAGQVGLIGINGGNNAGVTHITGGNDNYTTNLIESNSPAAGATNGWVEISW